MRNLVIGAAIATLIALLFGAAPQVALGQAQTRQPTADGVVGVKPQQLWCVPFDLATGVSVVSISVPPGASGLVITDYQSPVDTCYLDTPSVSGTASHTIEIEMGYQRIGTHGVVVRRGESATIRRRSNNNAKGVLLGYTF